MSSVSRMMITSQMMWNYIVLYIFNVIASADYLNVIREVIYYIIPQFYCESQCRLPKGADDCPKVQLLR